jgi:carboxypeptidase Taq
MVIALSLSYSNREEIQMEEKFSLLKKHLAQIEDLEGALRLMHWDQQTYMPAGASQTRADQIATISRMAHELQTRDELGQLLEDLNHAVDQWDYDSDEASIIRFNWREYQKLVKIPAEKMEAFTAASAMAYEVWKQARAESNFDLFSPHLDKLLNLQLEFTEFLGEGAENPYDSLIDFYEPGMRAQVVDNVFANLKSHLVNLIKSIGEKGQVEDSFLHIKPPQDGLLELSRVMAEKLGYSFEYGRLDLTTHPFTSGNSYRDARITTRIQENDPISTLFSSIHEAGHAIHRQQCSPSLYRTLTSQYSMGIGESQSRLYEMIIGRSRAFWIYFYPQIKDLFPTLKDIAVETFYRAINKVQPGPIRVDADPVTYGLHIMLRFELENLMLNGKIKVRDLPEIWNAKMEEMLDLVPQNDARGVLQDVHWTGLMGYFPSYLLGSIFAVQLWYKLCEELPETDENMAAGEFEQITHWLGERIHQHGGKFTLHQIAERAVGEPLSSEPFIHYLKDKYGEIYEL